MLFCLFELSFLSISDPEKNKEGLDLVFSKIISIPPSLVLYYSPHITMLPFLKDYSNSQRAIQIPISPNSILPSLPQVSKRTTPSSSHSTIRQVPDNQEVYLDSNGFTSLTIDLTERVTHFSTDKEALEYHFDDIVAEGDTKQVLAIHENVKLVKFP